LRGEDLARRILSRDRKNLSKALYPKPGIATKRAYEEYVEDVDGRRYLDFTAADCRVRNLIEAALCFTDMLTNLLLTSGMSWHSNMCFLESPGNAKRRFHWNSINITYGD
jgi:acetylornithine/succinyldiaminopimelate/putrescine aminotransferase